jgi:hypothetical protein
MIYVSLLEGIRCMLTLQVSILLCVLCWVLIESGNLSREAYELLFPGKSSCSTHASTISTAKMRKQP